MAKPDSLEMHSQVDGTVLEIPALQNKTEAGKGRILLVDDNAALLSCLARPLRQAGYDVRLAGNGDDALALLEQMPVDVVVMDIIMPQRDGLQTMSDIRKRWPGLKLIAMSGGGYCGAGLYLGLSLKLGAMRIFEKPFEFGDLLAAIETELDGAPLEAA